MIFKVHLRYAPPKTGNFNTKIGRPGAGAAGGPATLITNTGSRNENKNHHFMKDGYKKQIHQGIRCDTNSQ
jgi:hypothetical protein